jgi:hypothetical protein
VRDLHISDNTKVESKRRIILSRDIFLMDMEQIEISLALTSLYRMGFYPRCMVNRRGGKSSEDKLTKIRGLSRDQLATDKGISALLSNLRNETPLVLIMGSQCRAAPV